MQELLWLISEARSLCPHGDLDPPPHASALFPHE